MSLVLVHTTSIGVAIIVTGILVMGSEYRDGRRVTLRTFIIDLLSSKLDSPWFATLMGTKETCVSDISQLRPPN